MSIELIRNLRKETGAGIQACKDALNQAHADYDLAKQIITASISAKEPGTRVAAKGLCAIKIQGDEAIVFEINAETDFAAKNPYFLALLDSLKTIFAQCPAVSTKQALSCQNDSLSVEDLIRQASAIVSENLILRRFYRVRKQPSQSFGSYLHQDGKVIGLVITARQHDALSRHLARHIVAMTPVYLDKNTLDSETIAFEKMMYEKKQGHFDDVAFGSYLESISLVQQPDLSDATMVIADVLKKNGTDVIDFFRIEVGQGIENKLNCRLDIPCDGSKITVMPVD